MKVVHYIAYTLVLIGALNWGLVGAFHFNLVNKILGSISWLETLVYILVGVAAIVEVATHYASCKYCEAKPTVSQPTM
jgi:uncharacterized membrane protein YuzA (DUF378 family)